MKAVAATAPHLSIPKLRILAHLFEHGETPAWVFDEDELDELFKMRPRLIRLVLNINPIMDITRDGEAAFHKGKGRLI